MFALLIFVSVSVIFFPALLIMYDEIRINTCMWFFDAAVQECETRLSKEHMEGDQLEVCRRSV